MSGIVPRAGTSVQTGLSRTRITLTPASRKAWMGLSSTGSAPVHVAPKEACRWTIEHQYGTNGGRSESTDRVSRAGATIVSQHKCCEPARLARKCWLEYHVPMHARRGTFVSHHSYGVPTGHYHKQARLSRTNTVLMGSSPRALACVLRADVSPLAL